MAAGDRATARIKKASWSPTEKWPRIRPSTLTAESTSRGAPVEPSRQSTEANLSTRSPVSSPKRRARSTWSSPRRWSPIADERSATGNVWLRLETQTRKFGGSMLHWVTKPARQPLMSAPAARTVTT